MTLELAALERYLREHDIPVVGALQSTLIAGGRSNLTYAVTDGVTRWAVRRPPAAGRTASAHDVGREFRVTASLSRTDVPVAPPLLLCEDDAVLGAPFTVTTWIDGTVLRDRDELGNMTDDQVAAVTQTLIEVLVSLHAVDPASVGLAEFGRPAGFLERQVALWRRQWDAVRTRDLPDVERLHERLAADVPRSPDPAVLHGDFRLDNAILHRDDPTIVRAVVDWELSTLGDPLTDVALMCVYRHAALDVILGLPAAWTSPRLPSPDDLAHAYAKASGRDLDSWSFYLGLAHLKLAVIAEGIAHRALQGADAGRNAHRAAEAVPDLVDAGLAALER